MQKLNEDFLDAIQNDTQQDTVDVASNGAGDKADYPITVSLGPTANLIIDDTPETIREHIIRVLEQTPQVVSYSRIEVNLKDGNGFRSGIYVRKMGNYDGYLVEYENEDPVIFGLKTQFKSGMQVWRFMCNLLKNVYYRENIAISVINEDKMSGCFWKFEDVLDWKPNKQGFNLVKSDESIAFRSLVTVLRVFLPDKDPIQEAQKIMVNIDFSQNFRQSVVREFIADVITRSGSSINTIHISNETQFDKIMGKRLLISDIIEKEQMYKFRAYVAIQRIVYRDKYYIKDVSSIENDTDFMGLSELEINSLSLYEVWSRPKTDYVCQMYGGYFLNINDNEYYNVSLFISSPIKEMINNIIQVLTDTDFKIIEY